MSCAIDRCPLDRRSSTSKYCHLHHQQIALALGMTGEESQGEEVNKLIENLSLSRGVRPEALITDRKTCWVLNCKAPVESSGASLYCSKHRAHFTSPAPSQPHRRILSDISSRDDAPSAVLLHDELSRAWTHARQIVFKDLPRLASRTVIRGNSLAEQEEEEEEEEEEKDGDGEEHKTETELGGWAVVKARICAVFDHFNADAPEKRESLRKYLASRDVSPQTDLELVVAHIFEDEIGLDTPTFRLFAGINQAVLAPACVYVRERALIADKLGFFKDVREKDGWTVDVQLGQAVFVTHRRREQAVGAAELIVSWELRLAFDAKCEQLRAGTIKILTSTCGEGVSDEQRHYLSALENCIV